MNSVKQQIDIQPEYSCWKLVMEYNPWIPVSSKIRAPVNEICEDKIKIPIWDKCRSQSHVRPNVDSHLR